MLSSTVYQGKSAGSWNTTARLGSGRSTRAPFMRTSPRVGRSKPATMLRSVDLPQPEGPRRAANSFTSTATSIAWSASTRRPRLTKSFHTSRSWIAGPRASAMSLESPPAQEDARGPVDETVREEAEHPHREHRRDADIHPADVVGVPEDVAEPGLHRDHLGDDHGRPRDPDAQAQARADRRQRRREDDLAEKRRLAGPQHAGGAQQQEVRVPHAVGRVHDDRIEGPEAG